MKILHVETGMHLYGGALQVRYLMEGLRDRGVENLLACPRGSEIARAAAPFARVYEVPVGGDFDPRLPLHLRRILRTERPGLLHAHSRRGADHWGGIAARLDGTPALLTRRVDNPEPRWIVAAKYGMFRKVVTISEGIRAVLLAEGVPADKLLCIPSAVDAPAWQTVPEREWFRKEFGLEPGARTLGVLAQLIPRKGHRYLLEAAASILEKVPETRFLFLGQGPLREELERLGDTLGLSGKVIFAGFRKDLPRILPCLDLVVHPALMEGLGVSLLQASAAGIPVVAARAGGIPEIVREGENGFLVEPGDAQGLVAPILRLLCDPVLAERFGRTGRTIVEERFSIPAMVSGYCDLYRALLPEAA